MTRQSASGRAARWAARLASLLVGVAYLIPIALAITNEDPPSPSGVIILWLLGVELFLCALAWRWQQAGGLAIVAGAVILSVVVGTGTTAASGTRGLVIAAVYGVPFLLVGLLFLFAGRQNVEEATRAK